MTFFYRETTYLQLRSCLPWLDLGWIRFKIDGPYGTLRPIIATGQSLSRPIQILLSLTASHKLSLTANGLIFIDNTGHRATLFYHALFPANSQVSPAYFPVKNSRAISTLHNKLLSSITHSHSLRRLFHFPSLSLSSLFSTLRWLRHADRSVEDLRW